MEEVPGCMKLRKRKNFINKNIADAYTPYVIQITGVKKNNRMEISIGEEFYGSTEEPTKN